MITLSAARGARRRAGFPPEVTGHRLRKAKCRSNDFLAGALTLAIAARILAQDRTLDMAFKLASPVSMLALIASMPSALLAEGALPLAADPAPEVSRTSVVDLDEVVISALRTAASRLSTGVAVTALGRDDLRADSRASLAEVLASRPGVSFQRQGPYGSMGKLLIRGVGDSYVAVRIDGIRVDDPSHPAGSLDIGSQLSAGIQKVEILRGSQSALWGGSAVGGVVSITSLRPEEEGLQQSLDVEGGSYQTGALTYGLTQKTGPVELAFTATRFRTSGFSASKDGSEADGAETSRLSLYGRYQLTDALAVGGNLFTQHTRQDYDGYDPVDYSLAEEGFDQTRRETGARLFAEYSLGRAEHLFELTHYRISRDFNDPQSMNTKASRLALSWQAVHEVSDRLSFVYGLDWMEERADYSALTRQESRGIAGAFAQVLYAPSDALDLSAALRLDEDSDFGTFSTGRLAAAWHISEDTTLRAAIARGYRAPTLDQRFATYLTPYGDYYGTPELEPEQSWSYELGLEQGFAGGATLSASLFQLEIDKRIQAVLTDDSGPVWVYHNANVAGLSTYRGVELAAHLPISDSAAVELGYTLTDSSRNMGVPRHQVTAALSGMIAENLTGALRLTHAADITDAFNQTIEDYTLWDAQLAYQLSPAAEAYLRVENLTDEDYEVSKGYGTSGRAFYVGVRSKF